MVKFTNDYLGRLAQAAEDLKELAERGENFQESEATVCRRYKVQPQDLRDCYDPKD